MSKKADLIQRLIDTVEPRQPIPTNEVEDFKPVEQGMLMVLMRHMTENQAETSVRALLKAYEDLNELRVCQAQEIAQYFRTSTRKKGFDRLHAFKDVALELKAYLQEVFQQTHSMVLDRFVGDVADAWKMVEKMPVTTVTGGMYLMWVANRQVPVQPALVKLLTNLGLLTKPGTGRNAVAAMEKIVPAGKERAFTIAFYDILEHWDDEVAPSYVKYELLRETPYGKKAFADREASIAKAEAQRLKEEERERKRIETEEKKRIAAEKAAKKAEEAARKKAEREAARKKAAEERKAAAEKKRKEKEAERKKAAAKKEAAKKEAAKKAAAKKVAAKKAATKKAAAKKAAAKKAAAKKKATKSATAGKSSPKKSAAKKSPAKKAAATRSTAKKTAAKKVAGKKTAGKKTAAKKAGAKSPTTKKAPKKAGAKKAVSKKAVSKKAVTKKASKKTARVARR